MEVSVKYPYNPNAYNPDLIESRPSPAEQQWNRAAVIRYSQSEVPVAEWRLILAPGHNPIGNGMSPSILSLNSRGEIRDIDTVARYEEACSTRDFKSRWFRTQSQIDNLWNNEAVGTFTALYSKTASGSMRSHIVAESFFGAVAGEDGDTILDIIGFPEEAQRAIKGYKSVKGRVPTAMQRARDNLSPSTEPDYTDMAPAGQDPSGGPAGSRARRVRGKSRSPLKRRRVDAPLQPPPPPPTRDEPDDERPSQRRRVVRSPTRGKLLPQSKYPARRR